MRRMHGTLVEPVQEVEGNPQTPGKSCRSPSKSPTIDDSFSFKPQQLLSKVSEASEG